MSPKPLRVAAAEVPRAPGRAGWYVDHRNGSRVSLRHVDLPGMRVTVTDHAGETIVPPTIQSIPEQAGLTADELHRLL